MLILFLNLFQEFVNSELALLPSVFLSPPNLSSSSARVMFLKQTGSCPFCSKALKASHGLRIEHELLSVSGKKISVWPRVPSQPFRTCCMSVFPPCPDLHPSTQKYFPGPKHNLIPFSAPFFFLLSFSPLIHPSLVLTHKHLMQNTIPYKTLYSCFLAQLKAPSLRKLVWSFYPVSISICIWMIYLCGSLFCTISIP